VRLLCELRFWPIRAPSIAARSAHEPARWRRVFRMAPHEARALRLSVMNCRIASRFVVRRGKPGVAKRACSGARRPIRS